MSDRQPLTPQPAGWERDGVKQTLLQKAGQGPDLLPLSQTGAEPNVPQLPFGQTIQRERTKKGLT